MTDRSPKISVVMPAYNASRYIAESIRGILSQDFEDFELIVADDCSTDNTVGIVSSFDDGRIRLVRTESNTGSAKYPRELAIEAAKADLICWVDSDDVVAEDYLSRLWERRAETGADIICSRMWAERDGQVEYTLPRDSFDLSRIVSGKEAVLMTLDFPWEINLNGWLCEKKLWTSVSTFKSLTVNHMDADDYSAREILFSARKVAFSTARYNYRLHQQAITKRLTPKKFESVITDRLVYGFLAERYPQALPKIRKSLAQRMIALMRLYVVHGDALAVSDKNGVKTLLCRYFRKITLSDIIKTELPLRYKLLLSLPFRVSMTVIKTIN